MKIQRVSIQLLSVCVMLFAILLCLPAYGAETITVTQDQLELRSDPADNDENILGTLRANTPVVFTGNVSGKWYQITAPNGQTGWVHQSGISRPKSVAKPTPKPAATPKAEKTPAKPASRSVSKPAEKQPEKPSKSQAAPNNLETTNRQYKAQLDEKDRRIAELSKELDEVETKLTDVEKTATDLEQLRKSDESKLTEVQTQIASLNETIQQREDDLRKQKVEFIELQEALNTQTASQQTASRQRTLLLISLPLNLIGLILLGYFGIRHIARKQEKQVEALPHFHETDHVYSEAASSAKPAETPVKRPSSDALRIQISKEADPRLKDLDVVMTSSSPDVSPFPAETSVTPEMQEREVEETVIDLGDVFADESSQEALIDVSEPGVIITDDLIFVDEPIEVVHEDAPEPEIEATPVQSAPPLESHGEDIPEEPELTAEAEDSVAELDMQEIGEDVELEFDDGEYEETPIDAAAEAIAIDDNNMEALLADTQDLEQNADMDGLLDAGDLEEPTFEHVEIAGEQFETISEHGTQIIEMNNEEEEPYAETPIEGEMGIIDEPDEEPEAAARSMSEGDDALEFDVDEPKEPSFANLRVNDEIDELLEMLDSPLQEERASKQDAGSHVFAEPSPYLIEPEHEELETTTTMGEVDVEPKYTIELVRVGRNKEHVLHILSKVQGLPKTAEELLASTPCTIARGANKLDAQNFQMLMKKFGADVRLLQH